MLVFNSIIILSLVLLLYNFPKTFRKDFDYLNRDATASIRGVAMIGIILHHIALHTTYDVSSLFIVNLIINECGYPCTAIFFLFSGYGCSLSLKKQ